MGARRIRREEEEPAPEDARSYSHPQADLAARPEIGTQAHFKKSKPPAAYQYDSSLSPALQWAGKAERVSFEVPTLPLFVHERLSTKAIPETLKEPERDVREVVKSHVNYVVADTKRWEQSAAYFLDTHPGVVAFVKNAGLGLGIPYVFNGEQHEYVPDFIVRLSGDGERYLILETKGFDAQKQVKHAAAERWCAAVNTHGGFGHWSYRMVDSADKTAAAVTSCLL